MGNTILIVEDYPPMLKMLAKCFGAAGFQVYTAQTSQEAVTLASRHLPDCFLFDLYLADGRPVTDLCLFIRGHEQLKDAPILICSTHTDEAESAYANCQADVFLEKCQRSGVLLAAVNRQLRRIPPKSGVAIQTDLEPDPGTMRILKYGAPLVALSIEQFRLFAVLFGKRPGFVREEELSAYVFRDNFPKKNEAIASLVYRLRAKLGTRYGHRIICKKGRGWAYLQPRLRPAKSLQLAQ